MQPLTIRRMRASDLPAALQLTQAENWSHRLEDWEFHYRLGRGWIACDQDGKLLGTILWWSYGNEFGTIGLVVVDRRQQGKGIGRQLMTAVLYESGGRALQLVATEAGLRLYQQCGFRERGGIEQRQGMPALGAAIAVPDGLTLRSMTRDDVVSVCELGSKAVGADRREVISAAFDAGTGAVVERDGRVRAFALMRSAGRGKHIGPIVAGDQRVAAILVAHHLNTSPGFTRVDVPSDAAELSAWLDTVGLLCVDRVTTMLRGNPPEQYDEARTYGLISQALS